MKTTKAIPRNHWSHRMLIQEIATRIRTAMEENNMDLFALANRLSWAPAKVLRWIDGSLADANLDASEDGTLREVVDIGMALGRRWDFRAGKKS